MGKKCLLPHTHLRHHLVVGVPHEGDALQGGGAPGQQGHVGGHTEGNLHAGADQVLGQALEVQRLCTTALQVWPQHPAQQTRRLLGVC